MNYWLGIAVSDHVRRGVDGGFAQLGHGRMEAISPVKSGDWLVYYAPRERMDGGDKVQAFVAVGRVLSEAAYQTEQVAGFHPWRVDIDYVSDAKPAPIRPLLEELDLTRGRGRAWGMAVRGSRLALTEADFRRIVRAMGVADQV
ncbi:MAG: EVE domain-containing protein [Pseudomonadota bacterium]|nr:EVE domain-containing protein [Pseudomonadota bacterium]